MIVVNTIEQTTCQSARQHFLELTLTQKPVCQRSNLSSAIHHRLSNTRYSHVDNGMVLSDERERGSCSNSGTAHHLDFQPIISEVLRNKSLIPLPDILNLEDEQH